MAHYLIKVFAKLLNFGPKLAGIAALTEPFWYFLLSYFLFFGYIDFYFNYLRAYLKWHLWAKAQLFKSV